MESALQADQIIREIKRAGIRFVIALPDRTTSEHMAKADAEGSRFQGRASL